LKGLGRPAEFRSDQIVPMQNPRDRAGGRQIPMTQIPQPATKLACTPGWMFVTQRHHPLFHSRIGFGRTQLRSARTVHQSFRPTAFITPQPLVTHRWTNAKTAAQKPDICFRLTSQSHKLKSRGDQIFHRPRHSPHTLPTLAAMCPPCPRTPVHYVSGLYTPWRRGRRSRGLRWVQGFDARHWLREFSPRNGHRIFLPL
jgi:hypothetical protein